MTDSLSNGSRRGLFVTGTDTGIGKTLTCAMLLSALRGSGETAGYFKPVQTGRSSDASQVARLSGARAEEFPPPLYSLSRPASPDRAAAAEGVTIDPGAIRDRWQQMSGGCWIIEGAGGLLVPLTSVATMRDLVGALDLPALIVASTRLGTINHTLLTLEAARSAGLAVAGIVLNGKKDPGLAEVIAHFDAAPIIAEIPRLPSINRKSIARRAKVLFPSPVLRSLFGLAGGDARSLVDEDAP